MEDLVDLNWLENELKNNVVYSVSKVLAIEISSALNEGENYSSRLLRLKVKTLAKSGKEKDLSLILKRKLDISKLDNDTNQILSTMLDKAFYKEFNFYTNILPKIEIFIDEQIRPHCVAWIENHDLYLEDLKNSGFQISNRQIGLDADHCNVVFRSIAKLHAGSYIALSKGMIDSEKFQKYSMIEGTTGGKNRKSNVFEFLSQIILNDWGPEWKSIGNKLDDIKFKIKTMVQDVGQINPSCINVLNHGDLWVNNMMFKYESDGKPSTLQFVDFQMPHYNSLAFDLSYFLNTSVNGSLKKQHLNEWITTYCESFKNVLQLQNCNLPYPTEDCVKNELRRLTPFSLSVAIKVRPIIMCKPEDSLPISELIKDNGLTDSKHKIYSNSILAEVLKNDLPELFAYMEQ